MNTDEHDDLWSLLGKAKAPAASPFFSRNVLRAIREAAPEKRGVFGWLRARWQLAAAGVCAVLVAGSIIAPRADQPDQTTVLLAKEVSQSTDYHVISNLDELLASEESSVWLEK